MEGGGADYIQGGRVPRNASVGSSRQQGPSVPSSESSERVNEVRVGAVTTRDTWVEDITKETPMFVTSSPTGWSNDDIGVAWLKLVFDWFTKKKAGRC
jgi:hypothetical protein